jgi:hypothetical protein
MDLSNVAGVSETEPIGENDAPELREFATAAVP